MKQSKQANDTNSEEIIKRAKNLCFQGQYGRATIVLASDGFAPANKATLHILKKLHSTEEKPIVVQNFSTQANQFLDENFSEHLNSFSSCTGYGPSNMFPEHLFHVAECTASVQSHIALRVLTKLLNISCLGELPKFVSQALCDASLSALLKKAVFALLQEETS